MNWQNGMGSRFLVEGVQETTETPASVLGGRCPMVNAVVQGRGKPVVLVHGLAASLHDWDFLLPELIARGYQACALDLLGHGESEKPANVEEYTVERVFQHLYAWIESLNLDDPPVLIGHSLGAYCCLELALRYPHKVRGLVLVNPFYDFLQLPFLLRYFLRHNLIRPRLIEKTPYWLFRIMVDLSSLRLSGLVPGSHELAEAVRRQTAVDYKRAAGGIYHLPSTIRNLQSDLRGLEIPTLVIWGERDQTLTPRSFRALVESLPKAQGEVIPTCGHIPHQCHPEKFNRFVISFLDMLNA